MSAGVAASASAQVARSAPARAQDLQSHVTQFALSGSTCAAMSHHMARAALPRNARPALSPHFAPRGRASSAFTCGTPPAPMS